MQPITEFSFFFVVEREKPIKCHDRSLIVYCKTFLLLPLQCFWYFSFSFGIALLLVSITSNTDDNDDDDDDD